MDSPHSRKPRCRSARDPRPAAATRLEIPGHHAVGPVHLCARCSSARSRSSSTSGAAAGRAVRRSPTAIRVVGGGLTISLSVILGLPAVLLATWIAIRPTRIPFADYLALRWTSWRNFFVGVARAGHPCRAAGTCCRAALGREVTPGFMGDVLKSAQADGALWLLVIAFCVAAPMWEEIFRPRLSLPRLVGIEGSASPGAIFAVVAGLDRAASAVRLVLLRRGVFHRPVAGISCAIAPTRPG